MRDGLYSFLEAGLSFTLSGISKRSPKGLVCLLRVQRASPEKQQTE